MPLLSIRVAITLPATGRVHSAFQTQNSRTFTMLFQQQNYRYKIKMFQRNQSHKVSSTQEIPNNIVKLLIVCYHKVLQEYHH